MACKVRRYTTKYKLPLNHRDINRRRYLRETLYRAWEYHLSVHNLQIEDVVFRKITYDAIYDALQNKNGKIHAKGFLKEYENFMNEWNENYSHLNEKIADWENYRKSENYAKFLATIRQINRLDRRISITTDNALAYMYSKYQKGYTIGEKFVELEKKLRLDLIPKAWSKNWLWLTTTILVFDANDLYANTIGRSKTSITEWDEETQEAIKIYTTRWYERKDLELSEFEKTLFRVYENIIVPVSGELGSVAVAEVARRGTCHALLHIARALTSAAKFHPTLRMLSWGATLIDALRYILDNSILAWLGWQIGVEWQVDGTIQAFMQEAAKYIYAGLTGAQVWKARQHADWGLFDLAVYYTVLKFQNGKLEADQEDIVNFIKEYGSEKQKEIIARIEKAFSLAQRLYTLKTQWKQDLKWYRDKLQDYYRDIVIDERTSKVDWANETWKRMIEDANKFSDAYMRWWFEKHNATSKAFEIFKQTKEQAKITNEETEAYLGNAYWYCGDCKIGMFLTLKADNYGWCLNCGDGWDYEGATDICFWANIDKPLNAIISEEGDKEKVEKMIPAAKQFIMDLDRLFINIQAFGGKDRVFRYAVDTTYPELRKLVLRITTGKRECVSVKRFKELVRQHILLEYDYASYKKKIELDGAMEIALAKDTGLYYVEGWCPNWDIFRVSEPVGLIGKEIEIVITKKEDMNYLIIYKTREKYAEIIRTVRECETYTKCVTPEGETICRGVRNPIYARWRVFWTDWKVKTWEINLGTSAFMQYKKGKRSKILCLTAA